VGRQCIKNHLLDGVGFGEDQSFSSLGLRLLRATASKHLSGFGLL
jgi:hypothetical protein